MVHGQYCGLREVRNYRRFADCGRLLVIRLGERQMRIYPNTSTKRQRVSPETHLLALRAGMDSPAARLMSESQMLAA